MNQRGIESRVLVLGPKEKAVRHPIVIYSGKEINRLPVFDVYRAVDKIHAALTMQNSIGRMDTFPRRKILEGIREGRYVLSMAETDRGRIPVGTAQYRRHPDEEATRVIGSVVLLEKVPGHGLALTRKAIELALTQRGVERVITYVSPKNPILAALRRVKKLESIVDEKTGEELWAGFDLTQVLNQESVGNLTKNE